MDVKEKVLNWIANGKTGVSSKAMALAAAGVTNGSCFGNMTPSDPADFNRCLLLVDEIPEIKVKFHEIALLSPEWKVIIENWNIIEKSFIDEAGLDWCKSSSAPNTYNLMKKLAGRA